MSTPHPDMELLKQRILQGEVIHGPPSPEKAVHALVRRQSDTVAMMSTLEEETTSILASVEKTRSESLSAETVEKTRTDSVVAFKSEEIRSQSPAISRSASMMIPKKKAKLKRGMSTDSATGLIGSLQSKAGSGVPLARMDSCDSLVTLTQEQHLEEESSSKTVLTRSSVSSKRTTTFFRYSKASLKHLLRQQSE